MSFSRYICVAWLMLALSLVGCAKTARSLALDQDLAHASLDKALKAWADGKKPDELQPDIIVGDAAWKAGQTLVSFEIKKADAWSDGTNLYIPVACQLKKAGGKTAKTETTYVVGTSPVVTIFPQ